MRRVLATLRISLSESHLAKGGNPIQPIHTIGTKLLMRVERAAVSFQPYTARTPIKYGAVEMSEVTFCLAEVEVVSPEGQSATGHGGIFLADLWAFPDPAVSHEAKDAAMRAVSRHVACWLEGQSRWGHPLELGMAVQTALTEITATASRNASLPLLYRSLPQSLLPRHWTRPYTMPMGTYMNRTPTRSMVLRRCLPTFLHGLARNS